MPNRQRGHKVSSGKINEFKTLKRQTRFPGETHLYKALIHRQSLLHMYTHSYPHIVLIKAK